ncbi:MAG: endo-1,4-beta-xylanase [Cyclonatronaceae bacterium]
MIVACLAFWALLLSNPEQARAQVTINPNGGLETSEVGEEVPEGWDFQLNESGSAEVVADEVLEGSRALKIELTQALENSYDIQVINGEFDLEPGVTYTYSAWAKADAPGASAHFTVGNASFQEMFRSEENGTLDETWRNISGEFTVPEGDVAGRAPIHISFEENVENAVYIDALRITKLHSNDNGSFETAELNYAATTDDVRSWTFETQDVGEANFAIVDDPVADGSRALGVTVGVQGDNSYSIQAINEPFTVVPGETYEYSVYARSAQDGGSVHFTVGNPSFQESLRFEQTGALTTEWQQFTTEFTVSSSDVPEARAPIHFSFAENVGNTIYIDSLRITQVTGTDDEFLRSPVVLEANAGTLGSEWDVIDEDDNSYISITTDFDETTGTADYPGENRVASYTVSFPGAGDYDMFAKVRVGPNQFDDDSFFTSVGFGEKDPANAEDWVVVNGLATAGFADDDAVVRGPGNLGEGVWKWVNLSKNEFQNEVMTDTYSVSQDELTQTIQIGARELGLDIEKIAFGRADLFYTVGNLENGEPGSETDPGDVPEEQDPIADGKSKWLGNVYSPSQIENFTSYWNQVTAENAGKWGSVEGTRDQMNWGELDASYNLAKDNGLPYRFHILTWGGQQPGWINDLEPAEQLEEITEWYELVAERYPDIEYLEVVNEGSNGHQLPDGISGEADYIDALGGTGETGFDWIITSFEMAREIFPADTKLMINDYNILSSTNNALNYKQIIDELNERGLIDVIGVQGHAFSTNGPASAIESILDLLAETGLPIQVTEFDVDGDPGASDAESDQVQLEEMQRIFPTLWEHPAVEGITLWGWRPGLWRQDQDAFLIRNSGEERPALVWLREYVENNTVVSIDDEPSEAPSGFKLHNNYPNPFNPTTQISYDIGNTSDVSIRVYDILGRQVQTLVDTRQTPGTYTLSFDASGLSSGIYFYRIQAGSFSDVKQMTLIK